MHLKYELRLLWRLLLEMQLIKLHVIVYIGPI